LSPADRPPEALGDLTSPDGTDGAVVSRRDEWQRFAAAEFVLGGGERLPGFGCSSVAGSIHRICHELSLPLIHSGPTERELDAHYPDRGR